MIHTSEKQVEATFEYRPHAEVGLTTRIFAMAAGLDRVGMGLLRLPGPVKEVFEERMRAALPLRADRIVRRIKETRGGKMYDSRFGVRGKGEGVYAEAIQSLFQQTTARLGLASREAPEEPVASPFRRPTGQLGLF